MSAPAPATVAAWLGRLAQPCAPPLKVESLGSGKSNLTWRVNDQNGRSWVLRQPPPGALRATAHDIAREHRVLTALADTGVPHPRVHGYFDDLEGGVPPTMIMEFVEGLVVEDAWSAGLASPQLRHAAGLSFVDALARVHAVDLAATGLEHFGAGGDYAPRQIRRWLRQGVADGADELPQIHRIAARLASSLPQETERTLVHGDCHLRNAVVDPSDGHVRSLLDWELATLGDPLADIGLLLAYWPDAGDPLPPGPLGYLLFVGFANRAELADRYASISGRPIQPLGFWTTLAAWKIAIISLGILRRIRKRDASSAELVGRAAIMHTMLDRAEMFAAEAGL